MPIRIPKDLPASQTLQNENIFVMDSERATSQDIRPLRILILNLMPTKIVTETQLARLLGNTPIQIDMELLKVRHESKNVTQEHMLTFYKTFDQVRDQRFDGMVITGAPKTHVYSTYHICWGAQAGLYYHYGIRKLPLPEKMFGVFKHRVTHKGSILFRGFDDVFLVPHSRHTTVDAEQIKAEPRIKILAESDVAGVYAVSTHGGRQIFITGHSEYDTDTLKTEYFRDKNLGLPIHVPVNYFPDDDDTKEPLNTWRSGANLLYCNWLNYFVYQETPYELDKLEGLQDHDPHSDRA